MLTAEDFDRLDKGTQTRTTICLDSDTALEIERLEEALDVAIAADEQNNRPPEAPALAAQILELQRVAKESEVEFVFRDIGRHAYDQLLQAHPPTSEQRQIAEDNGGQVEWNIETFPPALLAASCVSPAWTDRAWWTAKWSSWGLGRCNRLLRVAVAAQVRVNETPKAERAYSVTHASELRSGLPGI